MRKFKINRERVLLDIQAMQLEGKIKIFENQTKTAKEILENFRNLSVLNQMVLGKTQSGKTGCMVAVIKELMESEMVIPVENIYIITGLSSRDWKKQTTDRFPEQIQKRVFHRNELGKIFYDDIKAKRNCLIVLDECHIASKKEQTISNVFNRFGLLKKDYLLTNDIKILEFSATPDGTLYDLENWGDHSVKVMSGVGDGYVGAIELLQQGRLRQFKPLYNEDDPEMVQDNIKDAILAMQSFRDPRYHIIRTKTGEFHDATVELFIRQLSQSSSLGNFDFMCYDERSQNNINTILVSRPTKHTIITIREKLRCANTLEKKYIGVLYERSVEHMDESVIIQGLVGRLCGYDCNRDAICYTNIETVMKYERLWNGGFTREEMDKHKWKSKTTGCSRYIETYNKEFLTDDSESSVPSEHSEEYEIRVIKKKTHAEIMEEFSKLKKKGVFAGRSKGPRESKNISNGLYYSNYNGSARLLTKAELLNGSVEYGMTRENLQQYRYYAVYDNITEKDSVEFWLIYFDRTGE
jgi:hypothetical protein